MKKLISLILALALALSLGVTASATNATKDVTLYYREIKIVINGQTINPTDVTGKAVEPFIIDDTTYLPVRAVSGALGLDVDWDEASSTITLTSGGKTVSPSGAPAASTGSKAAAITYRDIKIILDGRTVNPTDVNGKAAEPFIIDGTTYLPVRAVSGALGLDVDWDEASSTITLTTDPDNYVLSKVSSTITYEGAGLSLTSRSTEVYTYDGKGQLAAVSTYADDELIGKVSYTYDSQGRILTATDTGTGKQTAYKYSADGNTVTQTVAGLIDPSQTIVTVYDAKGNVSSVKVSMEDGSYSYRETYTYDEHGGLLTDVFTDSDGFTYTIRFTNTYDKNGNLLTQKTVDSYGSTSLSEYSYDAAGNLVKQVTTEDDAVTTTTITYQNGLPVENRTVSEGVTIVMVLEYARLSHEG